jgi:hypothetical protein
MRIVLTRCQAKSVFANGGSVGFWGRIPEKPARRGDERRSIAMEKRSKRLHKSQLWKNISFAGINLSYGISQLMLPG